MNKMILTMEEVLKNLTYNVTNICYKDNIKPIFRVTEKGFICKTFISVENTIKEDCYNIDYLLNNKGFIFVETDKQFIKVDIGMLDKLLIYLSKFR